MTEKRYPLSLDDAYVDDIVRSVTAAVPTSRIYIFGSYARGDERPDSDVDIYIVTDGEGSRFKHMGDAGMSLLWMNKPKDVIANSAAKFALCNDDISCIEHVIDREGVMIYG